MPDIGDIIRSKRIEKKLTQSALASSIGCDTSTISRLEKNQVVNPQLIESIFRLFEIDSSLMSGIDLKYETLKVGFGHCIWATPIINLLLNSKLNNVKFTSFGFNNNDPQFLDKENIYILPGFVDCYDGPDEPNVGNRKIQNWDTAAAFKDHFKDKDSAESDIKSYDASDLLDLLKYDELDCVVIPGDLYHDNAEFLERAASIMYTAEGGCELCVIYPENNRDLQAFFNDTPHIDKTSLVEVISQTTGNEMLNIFYSEDTIADKYLELYLMNELKSFTNLDYKPIDIGNWKHFWTDGVKPVLSKAKNKQNIALFLGWQPQTLWLKQALKKENTGFCLKQLEFRKLFKDDELNYLSFDVLFNRKGKWRHKPVTQEFFRHLNHCIHDLNAMLFKLSKLAVSEDNNKQLLKKYKEIVGCSKYLNMNMSEFLFSISELNFDLRFYHDWTYPISPQIN